MKYTRLLRLSLLATCALGMLPLTVLNANVITSSSDAMIWASNPTTNYGTNPNLFAIGTPGFDAYPLLKFDLSSYAGQTVTGNATFDVYLNSGANAVPRTVKLYLITIPWDASVVTYNNFGGSAGLQIGTDTAATASANRSVAFTGPGDVGYVPFTIAGSILQSWIDTPATNYGFALVNEATSFADLYFNSNNAVSNNPTLTFTAVPEPSTWAMLAAGLTTVMVLRRRMTS